MHMCFNWNTSNLLSSHWKYTHNVTDTQYALVILVHDYALIQSYLPKGPVGEHTDIIRVLDTGEDPGS